MAMSDKSLEVSVEWRQFWPENLEDDEWEFHFAQMRMGRYAHGIRTVWRRVGTAGGRGNEWWAPWQWMRDDLHWRVAWVSLYPNWDWAKQGGGKFHYFIMAVFSTLSGFGCLVFRIFPNWSKQAKLWTHAVCLTLGTRAEIRNLEYFVDY